MVVFLTEPFTFDLTFNLLTFVFAEQNLGRRDVARGRVQPYFYWFKRKDLFARERYIYVLSASWLVSECAVIRIGASFDGGAQ